MHTFRFLAILALAVLATGCVTVTPGANLQTGTLPDCPYAPRCKSSQAPADDNWHRIAPIRYTGDAAQAQAALRRAILAEPRTELIIDKPGYLYATFTTRLARFTDDVELLFDDDKKRIDVRSAGRIGWYDWGTNRRRVERLREAVQAPD